MAVRHAQSRRRAGWWVSQVLLTAACMANAHAETWKTTPSIAVEETFTNNVNLQPSSTRQSDFITQITPAIQFTGLGSHATITGTISLPILLYARTGAENNQIFPQASVFGRTELVEHFFYVEATANISQQFLTPFGATPSTIATQTNNQYTSQVYTLTPYIRGTYGNDVHYDLRDINTWTNANVAATAPSFTNELLGTIQRDPNPFGWGADYDRVTTKFTDQTSFTTQLIRGRGIYQIDPQLQVTLDAGYEENDYFGGTEQNAIYGFAFKWRPSDRTNFDAGWEHRFFGSSYNVVFTHRTPLSLWNVFALRNITSYPQQFAALGAGASVATTLNQLLSSRVTDPSAREAIVNQYIQDRGLPSQLTGPVNLYTQQITLQESEGASVGLMGARNTILFNIYRQHNEPITAQGNALPDLFSTFNNNTQYGATAVWSTSLAPALTLTSTLNVSRVQSNVPNSPTSKQGSFSSIIVTPISPLTSVYGGVRYQASRSTLPENTFSNGSYNEFAVYVGLTHLFR